MTRHLAWSYLFIYVLDEHNCLRGGEYDYITKLAVRCSAKRMYPDYI